MKKYSIRIPDRDMTVEKESISLGGSSPNGESLSFTDFIYSAMGSPFSGFVENSTIPGIRTNAGKTN